MKSQPHALVFDKQYDSIAFLHIGDPVECDECEKMICDFWYVLSIDGHGAICSECMDVDDYREIQRMAGEAFDSPCGLTEVNRAIGVCNKMIHEAADPAKKWKHTRDGGVYRLIAAQRAIMKAPL